jgi:hypothetical protein
MNARRLSIAILATLIAATPAAAITWPRDRLLSWSADPRGGIDITMAPLKPAAPASECMEFWHGNAELPLGAGGAFRRDRCS